ncbi:hypothetical protein CDAR_490101 [Caerostris darwini]|uniref:Uncharacterized protein n=1 Tax=Caerostris darwini TaxID=1538125 RepID=A0AAV4TR85_9ARAC|nr:hypothetical protein CDAR_490101 [Caerostris darwini]
MSNTMPNIPFLNSYSSHPTYLSLHQTSVTLASISYLLHTSHPLVSSTPPVKSLSKNRLLEKKKNEGVASQLLTALLFFFPLFQCCERSRSNRRSTDFVRADYAFCSCPYVTSF